MWGFVVVDIGCGEGRKKGRRPRTTTEVECCVRVRGVRHQLSP